MTRMVSLSITAALTATSGALAQWPGVDFADETATRLVLKTLPMNDNQEKDMIFSDFDQDGWDDLVVVRKIPFTTQGKRQAVLLMNENGVLVERTAEYAPNFLPQWNASKPLEGWSDSRDVIAHDINNDNWTDLVIANVFGDLPRLYINLGLDGQGKWLGFKNESERFGPIIGTPVSLLKSCSVAAADIENDGDLDLYFINYLGGDDYLMVNDGTGHFTDQTAARVGVNAHSGFGTGNEFHDIDHDGDMDMFKCTTAFGEPPFNNTGAFILWNNGSGVFNQHPVIFVPGQASAYMFRAADFNNDDMVDVYAVQDPQDQVILMSSYAPHQVTFKTGVQVVSPRTQGFGGSSHLADFDRDGLIDIGVSPVDVDISNCGGQMGLLRNMGDGKMVDPWPANQKKPWHTDAFDMAFFDINNDGCTDMFLGTCTGWKVFMQIDCPPMACYADCDQSGVLGVDDFICFQTLFALGEPSADCDGSGILGVDDFICFQTMFALGC